MDLNQVAHLRVLLREPLLLGLALNLVVRVDLPAKAAWQACPTPAT